jgi:type I restriction enzyme S subunit
MTPRGGKEVYVDEGIPFIRSQNVHSDGLHLEDIAHITLQKHAAMKRTQIRPNDVLLNITGASIGRSTYIPEGFSEANVNQHVCIIRTGWWMVPAYLSYFLNSPYGQDQIYATQSGVTREALNYTQVRSLQVPLAPLREQQRLVAKIEEFFSLAYKAEAAVKKAREKVQKIEQSVLAKAFRGELVPQDPSDEPASILLQRIKVDTEKMQIRARKRKRKIRPPTKVQQTRTKPPRSIRAFLKEMGQATVEQAFHASGLSMSDFWDELKKEIDADRIEQIRKGSSVFLRVKS